METWEQLVLAAIAAGILYFMWPGAKAAMERSKDMEKDWAGFLIPMAAVVLFVVFLIAMV